MPLPKFVHLTRPPRHLRQQNHLGAFDTASTAMWISTADHEGKPLLVARSYVDRLRADGWADVDQIPAMCIVEERA